jgi:hypothetical protein
LLYRENETDQFDQMGGGGASAAAAFLFWSNLAAKSR